MPTQIATFANNGLVPAYPCDCGACCIELPVALKDGVYARGTVLDRTTAAGGTNEVQTITITGTPTGGSFTISFTNPSTGGVETTAAIAYNATAAAVQAALIALDAFDAGDVIATGGALPGTAVAVTFGGRYAARDVTVLSTTDSLTGGTTPASSVAETTKGVIAAGTFFPYAGGTARAILRYGCTVVLGRIFGLGEHGASDSAAPAFFNGTFRCEDIAGLDADALTDLGARLFAGSVTTGIVHIP
jgi:hypothetical protein